MKTSFNPHKGLVLIPAVLEGPKQFVNLHLAVDTGASHTFINVPLLISAGYHPAQFMSQGQVNTAGGIVSAPRLTVSALSVLGKRRQAFPVVAHTLSASTPIDGLLGLDFFRGQRLTIDFRAGEIELS